MNNEILKKQLKIFFIVAFGLPYLMGFAMYYGKSRGMDITTFPIFQMMTPALATILALMASKKKEQVMANKFFISYIFISAILFIVSLASVFGPEFNYATIANLLIIFGSLLLLFTYFLEKKATRKTYNLDWPNKVKMILMILVFFILFIGRSWISSILAKENLWEFFDRSKLIFAIALIPNFFLTLAPFFGEEYAWRYFLQPILQKKYGMIKGVLILGILWGLWHLPLNLFYYSAEGTGLISLASQIVTCVTMSIFMAFAYNYTGSIWTAVWIHFINNNSILLFVENMDPSVIENNEFTWPIFFIHLLSSLVFIPFIFSKYSKNSDYRQMTALERIENMERTNEEEY